MDDPPGLICLQIISQTWCNIAIPYQYNGLIDVRLPVIAHQLALPERDERRTTGLNEGDNHEVMLAFSIANFV